ncbi:MAG: carbohydrate ABC transporter permease [Verrucomicrobia bacterium]|nr:carbohydrate ABC transporter permease [Verrucomicrobiota bacterium]
MNRQRPSILGVICTVLTVILALIWLFPVYWIAATALKTETQTIALPPTLVPSPPTLESFIYVIQNSPIFHWYFNTVVVSAVVTFCSILFSLMCSYALSRLAFKGKSLIYAVLLIGFMLPFSTMAIPLFMLMNRLHFVNTYAGIILPQIATPLSVIVFKQFFDAVPADFRHAAVIDGAGEFRILFSIYIPLNWSIIWALAIVTFIGTWNNFFWPFIVTSSTPMLTIPVGMTQVQSAYGIAFAKTSAIAVLASIPTAVAYLLFQKRVTQGVMAAAGIK